MDLRKQFDLGLLVPNSPPAGSVRGGATGPVNEVYARALENALVSFGAPILDIVRKAASPITTQTLAVQLQQRGVSLPFEQLLAVLKLMRDRDFLRLSNESDPFGNYEVVAI